MGTTSPVLERVRELQPDNGSKPVGKGELAVNVMDFGAAGDGITDDTHAIQAAADASDGTPIYFPPLDYVMDGHVYLPSNPTLIGPGATLRKLSGSTSGTCFVGFSNGKKGYGSGANNITVRGLTFRGTFTGDDPRGVCGFSLNHTDNLVAEDVKFIEAAIGGHQFDLQGCRNITIRRCIFQGFNPAPGRLYAEAIQIDCSARIGGSEKDAPGSYDGLPTCGVTVEDCHFLPLTVDGVTYPAPNPIGSHSFFLGKWYRDIKFRDNHIEGMLSDTTSNTPGVTHFVAVDGLEITGNKFRNTTAAACYAVNLQRGGFAFQMADVDNSAAKSVELAVSQSPRNVTIDRNEFEGFTNPSNAANVVMVYGSPNSPFTGVKIRKNEFTDTTPDYTNNGVGGNCIRLVNGNRPTIALNDFTRAKRAVDMSNCKNPVVADNTFEYISSAVPIKADACTGLAITGNNTDMARGFVDFTGCSRFTITGNTLKEDSTITNGPAIIRIVGGSKVFTVSGNAIEGTATTSSAVSIGGASALGNVSGNAISWGGSTKVYIAPDSPTVTQANNVTG